MMKRFGVATVSAFLVLALLGVPSAWSQSKKIEVRVGWQPLGGAGAIVDMLMMENKAFSRQAAKLGWDVTETWKEFQAGPPLNEAMAAGQIDIDLEKSTIPVVSAILAGVPNVPVAVTLSPLNNALLVAPKSPIKTLDDLRGKTVGLPIGSSAHYLLASVVYYHFGKLPEEVGIRLLNTPAAEAIKLPKGVDVASVWPPLRYIGPAQGLSEWFVDGYGKTGKGYKTPGIRVPDVQKSWAYPEGFNLDRSFVTAHQKFLEKYPELVRAFLEARGGTSNAFLKDPQPGIETVNKRWKLPELVIKQSLAQYSEFAGVRNSPSLIESDVLALVKTSEFMAFMKLVDRPLSFDDLKPMLMKGAEMQRQLWEAGGGRPTVAEMEKGFTGRSDLYGDIIVKGGAPIWQWASIPNWGKRAYIAGPFQPK
jgi:ABC-type nitrate/sulfonate/bicarbonate transport system substrate-binding protein